MNNSTHQIIKAYIASGKITVRAPVPNAQYKAPASAAVLKNRKRALERYYRLAKQYLARGLTTRGLVRSPNSKHLKAA